MTLKQQYVGRITFAILAALALAHCGFEKRATTSGVACATTDVKAAFASGMQQVALNSCTGCHAPGGAYLNFATKDTATAYAKLMSDFDVNDPSNSVLGRHGINNHCGPVCSGSGPTGFKDALQVWAKAETQAVADKASCAAGSSQSTDDSTTTTTTTSPTFLLMGSQLISTSASPITTTAFKDLTFAIPGQTGASFIVHIKQFTTAASAAAASYQINGINLVSPAGLHIENIRFTVVNGISSFPENTFTTVASNFASAAAPGTQVSASQAVLISQGAAGDYLKMEVGKISGLTSGGSSGGAQFTSAACTNLPVFTSGIFTPVVNSGATCKNCHSAGGSGFSSLNMFANDVATTCRNFKTLMIKSDFNNSAPTRVMRLQAGGHPNINVTTAQVTALQTWVMNEQ